MFSSSLCEGFGKNDRIKTTLLSIQVLLCQTTLVIVGPIAMEKKEFFFLQT
jgi:hypothetical protein